jgi:hypothetical protein
MRFESVGLAVPEIMIPSGESDMNKWAVVACDQYTSQPEYWKNTEALVGDTPSTLHIILPELYLDTPSEPDRIASIHQTMKRYLDQEILTTLGQGFVLVDRQTANHPSRKGLVVALDLEQYDYSEGSHSLIRATEGTIVSRLPPRMRVRRDASLESPHIMVLIDDPEQSVIEPLFNESLPQIYDFELMQEGGRIKGYLVKQKKLLQQVADALQKLVASRYYAKRYDTQPENPMLYAMGDGNHSLATAKAIWEDLKKSQDIDTLGSHPARYALVELVNLHDPGIEFEAIHRVVFKCDPDALLSGMVKYGNSFDQDIRIIATSSLDAALEIMQTNASREKHYIVWLHDTKQGVIEIQPARFSLETAELQDYLDHFLSHHSSASIDYIHGEAVVKKLVQNSGNCGFILPAISKDTFFKTIIQDGVFPRKTFSMGEAHEKRYYIECRKIIND